MLKVVSLSKSKFAWLLGDDDLVHPYGLKIIKNLFYDEKNKDIDFLPQLWNVKCGNYFQKETTLQHE